MIVRFNFTLLFLSFILNAPLHAQLGTCSSPYNIILNANESAYLYELGDNDTFSTQHCSGDPSPESDYVYIFTAPEDGILNVELGVPKLASQQSSNEVLTIKTNCSVDDSGLIDCLNLYNPGQYSMTAGSTVYLIIQSGEFPLFYSLHVEYIASNDNAGTGNCACSAFISGNICESFDTYTSGQYISYQSPCWTPWNGINGSSIDGLINSTEGINGTPALEINNEDDIVMYLGDRTSGRYNLSFNLKRKSGRAAHFNLRQQFVANTSHNDDLSAYAVFLLPNDEGHYLYQGNNYQFTYDSEGWIQVDNLIDLDNDLITLYINGVEIASWPYSYDLNDTGNNPVVLDAINFWSYDSQNYTYEFYVDNLRLVNLSDLPDCQVSSEDLLCMDWLRSELETLASNYTDCGAVNYQAFVYAAIIEDNNGNNIIAIYDNAFIDASFGYYYDCTGTFIGSSFISFISSYDPPYLEDYLPAFDSFEQIWDCTQPLPPCQVCPDTDDLLCLPWVQSYIETNYSCDPDLCGSISLYNTLNGDCVIDFVQEAPCLLTVCPAHEVFDLDGNMIASYGSECGLEGLGYTNPQYIWDCFQSLPDCTPTFCECQSLSCSLFESASVSGQTDATCSNGYTNYGCTNGLTGPDYVYNFYAIAEQDIYFELNSPDELYLMVMDACPPNANCLDYISSTGGGKVITIPEGGAYLVIDGIDAQGSSYTLSYNCNIQPPQTSDCIPDPTFTDFYQNDAEVLAAVQMINDPAYASTIEIPTDLFDLYYDRLNAIFNATDIPERDTVIECLNIHNASSDGLLNQVDVIVILNTEWAEELINGIFPTSNAEVNSLINQHSLSLTDYYQSTNNWSLGLTSDHNLNTQALANAFATIPGVVSASPNYITIFCLFDGISATRGNNYVDIDFFMAIPCVDGVSWKFRVYDDCSVQFLQRTGNNTEIIFCNDNYQCEIDPLCLPWMQDTLNYYTPSNPAYCTPGDPVFGYGLSRYAYNDIEVFGIGWVSFDTWEIRYYDCTGNYLGINYNYDGTGGVSEPDYLFLYEYIETIWDCEEELPACSECPAPDDILCLDWVRDYINDNYPLCASGFPIEDVCGSIYTYASPEGYCVIDFVQEISCWLTVCPAHEVFDLDGNLISSYDGECGLEGLGYTNPQLVWSCGESVCPVSVDCPNTSQGILCLDWLQDTMSYYYASPEYCEPTPIFSEYGIYLAIDGADTLIAVYENNIDISQRKFYSCNGTYVGQFYGGLIGEVYDPPFLENFTIETLWDCSQPFPNCDPNANDTYTLHPILPSTPPCTGETLCVAYTVENFTDITGSLVDMNWDAGILAYQSVGNLHPNITGLDLSDFDLSNVSDGNIILDWETVPCDQQQAGDGITLNDNEIFFEVCFTVIGGDGESTSFEMSPDSYAHREGIGCLLHTIGFQPNILATCGEGLSNCDVQGIDILCQNWVTDYINSTLAFFDCGTGNFEVQLHKKDMDYIIDFIHYDYLNACPSDVHALYNCMGTQLDSVYIPAEPGCFQWGDLSLIEDYELIETWNCSEGALPNCTDAPWTPQNCASGNTHFIQVIYNELESEIGGMPLTEGDWLGLFYQKNDGSLVCLDQAQFADPAIENGFQLTACAESSPGADDGFALDEPFQFKIFKEGVEYDAGALSVSFWGVGELIPPVYPEATSRFEGGALSSVIRSIRDFPDIIDPDCDTPIPISCGQSLLGNNENGTDIALSYNCFTNVVDGPEVIYTFTITQDEDILITLDGLTDDLELLLLDACDRDHCIAKSERTGSAPEVIHYEDLPAGDYFIIVEGYIGYESTYNLSLDCGDFPQGAFTCDSETIECGDIINSSTVDGCSEVNYYSCGEAYTPGKERIYRIRFDDPINVRISLQPEDADLDLFFLDALDPERCIYFSNESGTELERILIDDNDIIPNRDYFIIVDEYQSVNGSDFELRVECAPDGPPCPWCPPLDICDNVQEIECNNTITGHTQSGQSRVEKWGDCSSYNIGPELIYHFYNPEIQDVQFVLGDFTENLNFYVLRGDCSVYACDPDWQGNKSGLIEESILITAMPEGDYYLVVDSYDASSSFTLEVKCDETVNDCFAISVVEGFSYISSNVTPNDPDITNILNANNYAGIDIMLSDDQLRNYNPHFTSPNDPNAIKVWDVASGYRIDVSEPIEINFCGEVADTFQFKEVSIDVFNNYIAYPFQSEMRVKDAFANSPNDNLTSVLYWSPNAESTQNYNLAFNIGENFNMIPGNGYILRVSEDGEFSYRNNEDAFVPNGCAYFRTPLRNTLQRSFIMAEAELLGSLLSPGDEIGFFTKDGLICGSGKYNGYNLIITLQGDNLQTDALEGYEVNEPMIAKWWQQNSGQIQEVAVSFQQHDLLYENNYTYQLESLHLVSNQLSQNQLGLQWAIHPNPTQQQISIEYHITQTSNVEFHLLAADGHSLIRVNGAHSGGTHQQTIDMSDLPKGIYFLQLTTELSSSIKKVVKQ